MEKYPQKREIELHKKEMWTTLVQFFSELVPRENIEGSLRKLMGDAALWVNNNYKKIDLERVKVQIGTLQINWKEEEGRSKSLTQILAELDWKEILREAIQLRSSSWADRPVVEYRNAGDTIYCALMMELRKRGHVR